MALTKITSRILDSSGVTILGTIATGVWQGTAINQTYLVGQSGTNTGDETLARINALDVTELGTVSSGVWNGTAIASAYLDADTAHLSTTQTFTGAKTFSDNVLINKASNPTSLQIGSSLADDPFVVFQTDGNTMSMGIDRGDSNKFKISDNATLGTNDRLTITTGGLATFSGDVKVNEVNPLIFVDSTSTNKASGIITSESGTNKWATGTNFGSSDNSFNIYNYTAGSRYLTISSGGDATFSGSMALGGATIANSYLLEITAASGNIMRSTRGSSQFSMYQANNSDVYLGTTSNNRLRFLQNDGDALCIDTNKNVGVGTTSPDQKLEIQSSSNLYLHIDRVSGAQVYLGATDAEGLLTTSNSKPLIIKTNNTTALTLDTSQNATFGGNVLFNLDGDSTLSINDGGTNASQIKAGAGDELYIGANNTYALRFLNNGTNDVVFDAGSSIGIGTSTIESYWTGYTALKIGADNSIYGNTATNAGSALFISQNLYQDANNHKYVGSSSNEGGVIDLRNGTFTYSNAAAGTAGSVATIVPRLSISSGGDATFSKSISLTEMATIIVSDISTGENRGLKLENTGSGGKTWNITPGLTGVNNSTFTIRNATDNVNALTIDAAGNTFINGGNLGIGTAGKGIDFTAENTGRQSGADRTGSILDDYEEGTWDPTPGRTGGTQPNVSTYAYREGTYVKVGKLVTVMWDFQATITSQGSTAAISIKGLPFAVGTSIANGGKMAGYSVVHFRSGSLYVNTTAQRSLTGFAQQGASYIYVESQKMGTDGFASAGSVNNYLLNVSSARSTGTCTYFTNA